MRPACATPSTWKTAPRCCARPAVTWLNRSPPSAKMAHPNGHRCNGNSELYPPKERVVDSATSFNLSALFNAIAQAIPDQTVLIWREKRLTYRDVNSRVDGIAHYLRSLGLGCRIERAHLATHERKLPGPRGHLQLQLPLLRERTPLAAERLPGRSGGLPRRVCPAGCRSPRQAPHPQTPHPGRGPIG